MASISQLCLDEFPWHVGFPKLNGIFLACHSDRLFSRLHFSVAFHIVHKSRAL
jgi:hypothetical protein